MSMKAHLNRFSDTTLSGWREIKNTFTEPSRIDEENLSSIRDRVLEILVACIFFLGMIMLIPIVYLIVRSNHVATAFLYPLIYMLFIYLMMMRRLSYKAKVHIILVTMGGIGIQTILTVGVFSSGPIWLFALAIMASILLGFRAALLAIGFNTFVLVTITWVHYAGFTRVAYPTALTFEKSVLAVITFLFLNALSALSIAVLNIGFVRALSRARKADSDPITQTSVPKM